MTTKPLTDAQRVVLAAAAARDDGLILPVPKSIARNRGIIGNVLGGLIRRAFVDERAAKPGEEVYQQHDDGGRTVLVINRAGLLAIGVDDQTSPADGKAPGKPKASGRGPIQTGPSGKLGVLVSALQSPNGATISTLMEKTGWQAHSVRGAISAGVKKKLGLQVTSEVVDGVGRVYRIKADRAQKRAGRAK